MDFPSHVSGVVATGAITGTGDLASWGIVIGDPGWGVPISTFVCVRANGSAYLDDTWPVANANGALTVQLGDGTGPDYYPPDYTVYYVPSGGTAMMGASDATAFHGPPAPGFRVDWGTGTLEAQHKSLRVDNKHPLYTDGTGWTWEWDSVAELWYFTLTGTPVLAGSAITPPGHSTGATGILAHAPYSDARAASAPSVPLWQVASQGIDLAPVEFPNGFPSWPATPGAFYPNLTVDDHDRKTLVYERRNEGAVCSRIGNPGAWSSEMTVSLSGHMPVAERLGPSQHVVVCYSDGSTTMLSRMMKWNGTGYDIGAEKTVGADAAPERATLVMLPNGTMQCYYRLATGAATGLKTTTDGETWG